MVRWRCKLVVNDDTSWRGALINLMGHGGLEISAEGYLRSITDPDPAIINDNFIYIVQTATGQQMIRPAPFAAAPYHWKNDPEKVHLFRPN